MERPRKVRGNALLAVRTLNPGGSVGSRILDLVNGRIETNVAIKHRSPVRLLDVKDPTPGTRDQEYGGDAKNKPNVDCSID